MAEKKIKRGPKPKSESEKKRMLRVSAKMKNHKKILKVIEPIIEKLDAE